MYKIKKLGNNRQVGIAQTGAGWNVSTWTTRGNRVTTHKSVNTRTLQQARKQFTIQKRRFT